MSKTTEQKVLKHIDQHKLIEKGDKVLVALSGGADSVFLFFLLLKFKRRLGIEIGVFHLNHNLRGEASKEDEEFCRVLAKKNKSVFHYANKNVNSIAKKQKISLEEAGRILRYNELEKTGNKFGFSKIATAHNADDNAETIILNLIKGTGLQGIAGIPVKRGNIIRPILPLTKKEILSYLNKSKISFRFDESNLSNEYERNFLRNEIVPLLRKKLNPKLDESLFKFSENIRSVNDFINAVIDDSIKSSVINKNDFIEINLESIKKLDKSLHPVFFKKLIKKKYDLDLTSKNINALTGLLDQQTGRKTNPGNKVFAVKERDSIRISKNVDSVQQKVSITVKPGETKKIGGKKIKIELIKKSQIDSMGKKDIEYISADGIRENFEVRTWKDGDIFTPLGMKGSKKISDFLNEQKIPSSEKKTQLVLTNAGKIVWVIGLRIDERFKVTDKTKNVFQLCLI